MRNPFSDDAFLSAVYRLAAESHRGQKRKGGAPYITHPAAVALMLRRHGYSRSVVAAGLLHDTLEDTPCEWEDLVRVAGLRAARIVAQVSDVKGLPWLQRKRRYLAKLRRASRAALAVSAADKTHNLSSIVRGLQADRGRFSRSFSASMADKLRNYSNIYRAIRSRYPSCPILTRYAECLEQARRLAGHPGEE